jgi:hypothetical protein
MTSLDGRLIAEGFFPEATAGNLLDVARRLELKAANLRGLAREMNGDGEGASDLTDKRIAAADVRVKTLETGGGQYAVLIDDVEVGRYSIEDEARAQARGAKLALVAIAQAAVRADS